MHDSVYWLLNEIDYPYQWIPCTLCRHREAELDRAGDPGAEYCGPCLSKTLSVPFDREYANRYQRDRYRKQHPPDECHSQVYLAASGNRHRIGETTDMTNRMYNLNSDSPYPVELVEAGPFMPRLWSKAVEAYLHLRFEASWRKGSWFGLSTISAEEIRDLIWDAEVLRPIWQTDHVVYREQMRQLHPTYGATT